MTQSRKNVKQERKPTPDETMGLVWWNGLTQPARRWSLNQTQILKQSRDASSAKGTLESR